MAKLMGAALLIGCGAWWGLKVSGGLLGRVRDLEAWLTALRLLEGELAFSLPSMPDLLERLSRNAPPPAGGVFANTLRGLDRLGELPFEAIWTAALKASPGCLSPHDLENLKRLGGVLGRYGWEEQLAALRALRRDLEESRSAARSESGSKGRTYTALGFALGAFLTILLL